MLDAGGGNVKTKKWMMAPALAALCSVLAVLLNLSGGQLFTAASSAPFDQIAWGLRELSLASSGGNAAAIVLYVLLCIWPLVWALVRVVKNKAHGEDGLLLLLSAGLFVMLYLFINPVYLGVYNHAVGKAVLSGAWYSLAAAYAVLRLLRAVRKAQVEKVYRMTRMLLVLLCAVLAAAATGGCLHNTLEELHALHEGNTDRSQLGVSYLLLVLRFAVNALPLLLDIWVAESAMHLLCALEEKQDAQAVRGADELQKRCSISLRWSVLACALVNILQLCLLSAARQVHMTLVVPLESLLLLLCALLLSHLVRDMKRIRDENESFI